MIRQPGLRLRITAAEQFEAAGCYADRVFEFARRWCTHYRDRELPSCRIEVLDAPRQHTGLGVGTQLGLSVGAALHAFENQLCPPPAQLALSVGRGLRSAIGAYGFFEGGFIVERGKLPDEILSPLDARLDLPESWRVVLIFPALGPVTTPTGLSGTSEYRAFATLPAVPRGVTERLTSELRQRMLPAAASGDFDTFAESVYQYGYQAGLCFAPFQRGPYHSAVVELLVRQLRHSGVKGVGQSSWGPTLYAFQPNTERAEELARFLVADLQLKPSQVLITASCNRGARFSHLTDASPAFAQPERSA